jgi:hypothetical protein
MWHTQGRASRKHVDQAIDAARGGSTLEHKHTDRDADTTGTSERIDDPEQW